MIKKLKYMNVNYSEKDKEYIDYISSEIENKSKGIVDFFEIEDFNEKVDVVLFNSLEKFKEFYKETFKRDAKDYVCGFSLGNKVYTLTLDEYRKTKSRENAEINDLINLILHEFTHSVHFKRDNNMPFVWLNEGIATYLSGQHKAVKEIKGNLEDLINGKCIYSDYKLMFEYILNTYGKEYVLNLIDDEKLVEKDTKRLFEEAKNYFTLK